MKIKTFRPEQYRDCWIYYRNFKDHFEYLTIVNGELYTTHITVWPYWLTQLFCWLGFGEIPYTGQQLNDILKQLRRMAETTVDFVLDKK